MAFRAVVMYSDFLFRQMARTDLKGDDLEYHKDNVLMAQISLVELFLNPESASMFEDKYLRAVMLLTLDPDQELELFGKGKHRLMNVKVPSSMYCDDTP